ncbi:thioredoxin-like domain-containing protein [Campylobacter sp. JMF_01 NE2]|uniref:TlpA family protein disulfide reductase n=1 Tax=unclassified Campylobacter TaxID=2593542 RepID=UPI0022E9B2E2|nr:MULTISPECIES: thioredoxin-like domain-containing protein [unclassified Campylobacter]MDA3053071.1 thioredoxin-like domain-containing protein [Campylobacter sp. JMF_03 NE3]MDA3067402.1 thioredoxin-like domain-containing protein [Campylobacter sp. JMF_01 NE2]
MKFKILLALLMGFFVLTGCEKKDEQSANSEPEITQSAENENIPAESTIGTNYTAPFSLTFTNNQILNMQKNKNGFSIENGGKTTLFAFFASWCDACTIQASALNTLVEKYGDKLDVVAVLIADEISLDELKEYEKKVKAKFKIAYGEANDFFTGTLGGISEIPYLVVYDKKGKFSAQYFGLIPEEILTLEMEKIL